MFGSRCLVIFFTFTFVKLNQSDYTCDVRPIKIYGQIPSSVTKLFASATPVYEIERQKFGRNVSIETIPIFNSVDENEATDHSANNNEPILFSIPDGNRQPYSNEIKFPFVAL